MPWLSGACDPDDPSCRRSRRPGTNFQEAIVTILHAADEKKFLTGLLFIDEDKPDFVTMSNLVDEPLASLGQERTRPPKEALDKIMAELM